MGEYAEMMLDGTCCAGCGVFINGGQDGDGIPSYCASCAPDYCEEQKEKKQCFKKLRHELKHSQNPESRRQSITDRLRVMIETDLGGKMKPKTRRQYCAAMQVFLACFEVNDGVITHLEFEKVEGEQNNDR